MRQLALVAAYLTLALCHAAELACDCASVAAELAIVKSETADLRAMLMEMRKMLPKSSTLDADITRTNASSTISATLDPSGVTGRRLSHGSNHLAAVPAFQLHEFQNGGSCQPGTEWLQFLPKKRSTNAVTFSKSISDAAADLSLVSVNSDWTTTQIQAVPAPFKVVHDASCSSNPTLELPLDTTVSGTLTVGSTNIGTTLAGKQNTIGTSNRVDAAHVGDGSVSDTEFGYLDGVTSGIQAQISALSSGGSLTWRDLTLASGASSSHSSGRTAQCAVTADGMVHFRGEVQGTSLSSGKLATVPSECAPAAARSFLISAYVTDPTTLQDAISLYAFIDSGDLTAIIMSGRTSDGTVVRPADGYFYLGGTLYSK